MRRMIWGFDGRTYQIVGNLVIFIFWYYNHRKCTKYNSKEEGKYQESILYISRGSTPLTDFESESTPLTCFESKWIPFTDVQSGSTPLTEFQSGSSPLTDFQSGSTPLTEFQSSSTPLTDFQSGSTL